MVEPLKTFDASDLFPSVELATTLDGEHYTCEYFSSVQYGEARAAIRRFQADTAGNDLACLKAYLVVPIDTEDFCKGGTTIDELLYSGEIPCTHPLCK